MDKPFLELNHETANKEIELADARIERIIKVANRIYDECPNDHFEVIFNAVLKQIEPNLRIW